MDVFDLDLQKKSIMPLNHEEVSAYCTGGSGGGATPIFTPNCAHSMECGPTRGYGRAVCDITNI